MVCLAHESDYLFIHLVLLHATFSTKLITPSYSSIGFRNSMVNDLKVVGDKEDWGMFIDSCFTHCQTLYGLSWNSPLSPRLGNKARS
jgi:hypothetical protein